MVGSKSNLDPRGAWWKQIVKVALGIAVALGLRIASKAILPVGDIFSFARYIIIGLWIGVGAPWVFVITRLSPNSAPLRGAAR